MKRIAVILAATAMMLTMALSASAAIHPIVCSQNAVANGLVDNPARSDDIANPPGITPHDPNDELGTGFPHFDSLGAADHNPRAQFAPLAAQGFDGSRPNWFKDCGPTP